MIGAEGLTAAVAMELVATRAEELVAVSLGTGPNFEEGASVALIVIFDRKAVEEGVAIGAGGGSESLFHIIQVITGVSGTIQRNADF